ncbi:MAG: hypothetical protein JKY92_08290 [Magnetovibrio sp.]|nr:hypothetical protein [Magnetovibrio sp.]
MVDLSANHRNKDWDKDWDEDWDEDWDKDWDKDWDEDWDKGWEQEMTATVIAINHALGAIAVKIDEKSYVVLETSSQFIMDIGDTVIGDWQSKDIISLRNTTQKNDFSARVQNTTQSREDAIGCVSLI